MSPRTPPTAQQHSLDAPLMTFNLPEVLNKIKGEETWKNGKHDALTLLEGQGMRIVLIVLKKDSTISMHKADCPISVQVVEGCIKFNSNSESVILKKNHLLTLHAGLQHSVESMEESAFLLTLATGCKQ